MKSAVICNKQCHEISRTMEDKTEELCDQQYYAISRTMQSAELWKTK